MSKDCTRSHPHEKMDCCCQHKTDTAKAVFELSASQAREKELREKLADREAAFEARTIDFNSAYNANIAYAEQVRELKQRAEAAEARIKASQEHEPIYEHREIGETGWAGCSKEQYEAFSRLPEMDTRIVYSQPPIPPELAELQRENKQLRNELAVWVERFKGEEAMNTIAQNQIAELRKLLEESKVSGWNNGKVRYMRPNSFKWNDAQQAAFAAMADECRSSKLYDSGDAILVWVNEGDIVANGELIEAQPKEPK